MDRRYINIFIIIIIIIIKRLQPIERPMKRWDDRASDLFVHYSRPYAIMANLNTNKRILKRQPFLHRVFNLFIAHGHFKQLLDEVFVISGIIKVEVSVFGFG